MQLFDRNDINSYLNEIESEMENEIQNIPDKDMLGLDLEEFNNYFYNKYYIETINAIEE